MFKILGRGWLTGTWSLSFHKAAKTALKLYFAAATNFNGQNKSILHHFYNKRTFWFFLRNPTTTRNSYPILDTLNSSFLDFSIFGNFFADKFTNCTWIHHPVNLLLSPKTCPSIKMVAVATNGNGPQDAFTPVIAALNTMRDGQRGQKEAAHSFLESFQKSVCCVF